MTTQGIKIILATLLLGFVALFMMVAWIASNDMSRCGWIEARGLNGDIVKVDLSKATVMYEDKQGDKAITKVWHEGTWTAVAERMDDLTKGCKL